MFAVRGPPPNHTMRQSPAQRTFRYLAASILAVTGLTVHDTFLAIHECKFLAIAPDGVRLARVEPVSPGTSETEPRGPIDDNRDRSRQRSSIGSYQHYLVQQKAPLVHAASKIASAVTLAQLPIFAAGVGIAATQGTRWERSQPRKTLHSSSTSFPTAASMVGVVRTATCQTATTGLKCVCLSG